MSDNTQWNFDEPWWKPIVRHKGFIMLKGRLHCLYDSNIRSVKKKPNTAKAIKHPRRIFLKSALRYQNW